MMSQLMGKYNNKFWGGVSYRVLGDISILLGVYYKDFKIGYSYDMNAGPMKSYSSGSHEIMIIARFSKNKNGNLKSPRFFD